jgi:hypothetical protein
MKCLGSGENGEFTFLDIISIVSFVVGLENFDMNVSQEDMDKTARQLDNDLSMAVDDIHGHLKVQDEKLNMILEMLNNLLNAGGDTIDTH